MLFRKSLIIYLTRKKIWVRGSANSKSKYYEIAWDGNDPTKVFASIKKTLKGSAAKIILGNDLSYLLILQVPQAKTSRENIFAALPSLIPEPITTRSFDWKLIGTNPQKKLNLVQVVAVSQRILNNLSYAAKANKIKIDAIDVVGVLLASQTKSLKSPHLILWEGQEKLALVAQSGNVYFSEDISASPGQKVSELINFVEKKHGLKLTEAISDLKAVDKEIVFPSQWKVKKEKLDPMAAAAAKKPKKAKDEEALELKPVEEPEKPEEKKEETAETEQETSEDTKAEDTTAKTEETKTAEPPATTPVADSPAAATETKEDSSEDSDSDDEEEEEAKPPVNKKLLIILGLVIVVGGLVAGGTLYFRSRVEKPETPSETAQEPTATPEPEEVAVEDYAIQVLNGSGIAGEAGVVQGLLDSAGFEEIETGNASSFDFTDTEVRMKASVEEAVFNVIRDALSNYSVVQGDTLSDDSDYDIVVTVGSTKTNTEESVDTTPTPTPEP